MSKPCPPCAPRPAPRAPAAHAPAPPGGRGRGAGGAGRGGRGRGGAGREGRGRASGRGGAGRAEGGGARGATEAARPAGPHRAMAPRARRRRPLSALLLAICVLLVPLQVRTRTAISRRPSRFSSPGQPRLGGRGWGWGQVRGPPLERGERERQLEGFWGLEGRGLRNPDTRTGDLRSAELWWYLGSHLLRCT